MIETGDSLSYRGEARFPMMSVYKFPIAIAVLKELDRGTTFMERYLLLPRDSIYKGEEETYSDVNFPGGKITIGQLLTLMLVQSSNTACDQLLYLLKGPDNIQFYLNDLDIRDMAIANTEKEIILDTLMMVKNNKTKAASILNIDRKTLYNKLKEFGIIAAKDTGETNNYEKLI